jgi:DNA-binding MarR family transcriptional regulator
MELEQHVFFLCTQIVNRRDRALVDVLRPLQLLPTEWRILGTLRIKGPLSMLELAQWTAYERTRVTKILHQMEERGWVERTTSEADRRSVLVRLAPAGATLHRKAERMVDELNAAILAGLGEAEERRLARSLADLRDRLMALGY